MSIFTSSDETGPLTGKRVAILATEGFEQVELTEPLKALQEAGAEVHVIAPEAGIKSGQIKGWDKTEWGKSVDVDVKLSDADAGAYDALHLPGGVMNPDKLRQDVTAVAFVKKFFNEGKPVSAICHAPWMLIEADVVEGRTLTSWSSLRTDLLNAGARWVDREVVVDGNLTTSRKPEDLVAFNKAITEAFAGVPEHA